MKLGTTREKLTKYGVVSLILLLGWLYVRASLEPKDKWWEDRISYQIVEVNGALEELWSHSALFVDKRGGLCLSFIVAADKKVFIIGNFDQPGSETLIALDALKGTLLWSNNSSDNSQYTGLSVTSNFLYSGSNWKPTIRAYDLDTGEVLWSKRLSGRYIPCFRVIENLIYVETNNDRYLIQADTGKALHNFDRTVTAEEAHRLVGQLGGDPMAQTKLEYFEDVVLTEEMLFRGARAIDRQTGELLWEFKGRIISNVGVTPSTVYLITQDRKLLGLDARNGEVITWVQFDPIPATVGTHGYDNAFYVAADEEAGIVYAFLGDGAQLFAFRI